MTVASTIKTQFDDHPIYIPGQGQCPLSSVKNICKLLVDFMQFLFLIFTAYYCIVISSYINFYVLVLYYLCRSRSVSALWVLFAIAISLLFALGIFSTNKVIERLKYAEKLKQIGDSDNGQHRINIQANFCGFTTRCTVVQSAVLLSHVVCPSVRL